MKQGIVSLILVLVAVTGAWAYTDDPPVAIQQDDHTYVYLGSRSGSYMGVRTEDVTKERLGALKMKEETGAEVMAVDQDAPAGKAGIKEHDVIVTVNGQKVESEEQLRRMVHEIPPGRQIAVGLLRMGQPLTVQLTLADRKKAMHSREEWQMETPMPAMPAMPPMPPMDMDIPNITVMVQNTSRTGLLVENLSPQLAEFFGAKNGRGGVLVRSVEKGSVAEAAGFKAGDVILTVDKEKIADLGDFRRAVRGHSGATPVTVLREKKEQSLSLKLPERSHSELRGNGRDEFAFDFDFDLPNVMVAKIDEKKMKEFEKKVKKMSKDWAEKTKDWKFQFNFDSDEE